MNFVPQSLKSRGALQAWTWALLLLLAAGTALRLNHAAHAAWYWDEGYLTECAASLTQGEAPRAGALKQLIVPLPCSVLVPLSAAPLGLIPGLDSLQAARLGAVGLALLGALFMVAIARRCFGSAEAIWAAGLWAFWPMAVHYQALAFYHPFGSAALLAAACAAVYERPRSAAFLGGLAAIGCYWLWWCPVAIVALLAKRRAAPWPALLALAASAPLLHLGILLWADAASLALELGRVSAMVGSTKPGFPFPALALLATNMLTFPMLPLAILGLGLAWRRGLAFGGLLLFLAAAVMLEPWRQRGDLRAMHYVLIPALPWACLGVAWLAARLQQLRRSWAWALLALLLATFALPVPEELHKAYSTDPARSRELVAWLKKELPRGSQVMGLPQVNWALRPELLAYEPGEAPSALGLPGGFVPGLPATRFAFLPSLQATRALVVSRSHVLGFFFQTNVAWTFLHAEMQGWPKAFDNKTFRVYLNPRFGGHKDPQVRILGGAEFYRLAAEQARTLNDPLAAAFAEGRARSSAF